MNVLESHNTRRQFLRTLVGGAALAVAGPMLPALPVPESEIDRLCRALSEFRDVDPAPRWGFVMHPKTYRMLRDIQIKQDWYLKRHNERLARRFALGLPIGKPCA